MTPTENGADHPRTEQRIHVSYLAWKASPDSFGGFRLTRNCLHTVLRPFTFNPVSQSPRRTSAASNFA